MSEYLNWALNALKLPAYIIAGLCLGSLLLLVSDYVALIDLKELHPLARPGVIIAAIVFGSLSFATVCGMIYADWKQRHKATLLARRRELRRREAKQDLAEYQAQVLKRLDYLSKEEIAYLADCLRKNQQSFLAHLNGGHVSNLQAKGLVDSPGGIHHRAYYPFYIVDFVWEALLQRRQEFTAKDDAYKRQAEEEKYEAYQRRREELREGRF